MADDTDVLLKLYEEELAQARQSEDQRAVITNIVLVVTSLVLGFISQRALSSESLPITIFLIVLGIYGAVASQKLYERNRMHSERARLWRIRIDELHPKAQVGKLRQEANAKHKSDFPILERLHLYFIWLILHISITLAGIILTLIALFSG